MVRGEVYFMELSPCSGSERTGRRPCIIVSSDAFSANSRWQSITVVPLTSAARWRRPSPTTVVLDEGECNLPRPGAAVAHQVTTLDKGKIQGTLVGTVPAVKMALVDVALRNCLGL